MTRLTRSFFVLTFLLMALGLRASAATLTVTTNADSGPGSLRVLLGQAQSGDTVSIPPGLGTITLTSGQLTDSGVSIAGNGATIDAGGQSRVMEITGGTVQSPVTLSGLTLQHGSSDFGGGILVDAGATVSLTGCTLTGNSAPDGGGLYNNSADTSTAATVSVNVTPGVPTATSQTTPPVAVPFNSAGTQITLSGSDPDNPALPLTYALVGTNGGALHGGVTVNAATGAAIYTPSTGYSGTDTFQFTVNNGTNTSTAATVSVNVSSGAVSLIGGFTVNAVSGQDTGPVTVATFTDPNGNGPLSQYSAAVNWGDGTTHNGAAITGPVNGVYTVKDHHVYANPGPFIIVVTVHRTGAGDAPVQDSAHVAAGVSKLVSLKVTQMDTASTSITGGMVGYGLVQLAGTVQHPVLVTLNSSQAGVTHLPETVMVRAGTDKASFTFTPSPVPTNTPVTITASYNGAQSALITVIAPAVRTASLSPKTIKGGSSTTLTVLLTGPAPTGGTSVSLNSEPPGFLAVMPPFLTIPAGQTIGTVVLTSRPVSSGITVTVTATAGGKSAAGSVLVTH